MPFRTTVEDLILAALFRALALWTGKAQIQIDVEWHGREALPDTGIDLSRTVGWFTTIHPLSRHVDLHDLRSDLVQLKEQRRSLPDHGVSFNQLRFLSPWPEVKSAFEGYRQGDIVFNYSGLVHDRVGDWSIVPVLAMENAPENPNPYEMAVETRLQDGRLICDFYASPERVSETSANCWEKPGYRR